MRKRTTRQCLPRQIPTHDDAGEDAGTLEDAGLSDGGHLALLVPSGVEVRAGGNNRTLSWTGTTTSRSTLELSLDDGATWSLLATDVPASTFDWLVPMVDSEQCIGFDGANTLLLQKDRYNNNRAEDSFLENFDVSTNRLTQLAGVTGASSGMMCADGTPRASCVVSYLPAGAAWDAIASRWLVLTPGEPRLVRSLSTMAPAISTEVTLSAPVVSIALNRTATMNKLYFCRETGVLGVYDFNTMTESVLPWPIARMNCTGRNLVWVPSRNTVVFPFTIDGVGGIAEYVQ